MEEDADVLPQEVGPDAEVVGPNAEALSLEVGPDAEVLSQQIEGLDLDNGVFELEPEILDNVVLDLDEWRKHHRHVFILSSAGKPVYSRHGCEDKLVTLFGVMQALVSFIQDSDDVMEAIYFGDNVMVFLVKGPIILVAVSKRNDKVQFLVNELTYVYNQVVSILTLKQVTNIFEKRRNYDLRRLLSGSERLIDHLLRLYETGPDFLFDAVTCLPLPSAQRDAISNVIISTCSKIKNLVFAILIGNNQLITLVRRKKYSVCPSDLHLVFNLVAASESFKTAESWTPICLPNFNANGFLHGHVSYLTDDCPACLLLLTVDRDIFYKLSDAKQKITEKLQKNSSISIINASLSKPPLIMENLRSNKIRHFVFKYRKTSNVLSPPTTPGQATDGDEIFQNYQRLLFKMQETNPPLKLVFQELANETMMGWVTDEFELYVTFEPLISKVDAVDAAINLFQGIQKDEDKYFIANIPNF